MKLPLIISCLILAGCQSTPYAMIDGSQSKISDADNYNVEIIAIDGAFQSGKLTKNIKPGYHTVHLSTTGPLRSRKATSTLVYPLFAKECMRYVVTAQHGPGNKDDWEIKVLDERLIPACTPSPVEPEVAVVIPDYAKPTGDISCLAKEQLTNQTTPLVLLHSVAACIKSQDYNSAINGYFLAGAYAYFDSLRVTHKPSHAVVDLIKKDSIWTLSALEQQNFEQKLAEYLASEQKQQTCEWVKTIGAPDYTAQYMLQHLPKDGVPQNTDISADIKATLFNATLNDYLGCSSLQA
ncbi:hypothetical protein ACRN9A_03520 [Shewanella frigidimarina]|uniref:hypothetical protein n=1 Tax=Shewanella frigidimarina TaxID=56812 RepID=UPI003D7AC3FA